MTTCILACSVPLTFSTSGTHNFQFVTSPVIFVAYLAISRFRHNICCHVVYHSLQSLFKDNWHILRLYSVLNTHQNSNWRSCNHCTKIFLPPFVSKEALGKLPISIPSERKSWEWGNICRREIADVWCENTRLKAKAWESCEGWSLSIHKKAGMT